jgi:teichuronic acid biosynthesis glycosyltransferase TuaG
MESVDKNVSLVTVIMPVCNSESFVEDSIRSVLEQSYTNIELIIVDDGSRDLTAKIVKKTIAPDDRAELYCLDVCSGGPATPRNVAMKIATGSYIAFIDADDLWHPQKLEKQLSAMQRYSFNFVSSRCSYITNYERDSWCTLLDQYRVSRISHSAMMRKNRVVTSSAIVAVSILDGLGFNENAELVAIEDYLLWLQVLENDMTSAAVIEEPLVLYRLRSDSLSNSKLKMAKKIYYLLGNYQVNGELLGVKKMYYFGCYVLHSVLARIKRSKH